MTQKRLEELKLYLIDLELKQLSYLNKYAGENGYIDAESSPEQLYKLTPFRLKLVYGPDNWRIDNIEVFVNSYHTDLVNEPDFWVFQRLLNRDIEHLMTFTGE